MSDPRVGLTARQFWLVQRSRGKAFIKQKEIVDAKYLVLYGHCLDWHAQ